MDLFPWLLRSLQITADALKSSACCMKATDTAPALRARGVTAMGRMQLLLGTLSAAQTPISIHFMADSIGT